MKARGAMEGCVEGVAQNWPDRWVRQLVDTVGVGNRIYTCTVLVGRGFVLSMEAFRGHRKPGVNPI